MKGIVAAYETANGAELVRLHIQARRERLAQAFQWLGRQPNGDDVERWAT